MRNIEYDDNSLEIHELKKLVCLLEVSYYNFLQRRLVLDKLFPQQNSNKINCKMHKIQII